VFYTIEDLDEWIEDSRVAPGGGDAAQRSHDEK
jgi:hypothetical protein